MLRLFTIFHGNLQFSSIPKKNFYDVINRCYWPLIEVLKNNKNLRLGIEFSGETLLEILKLDPKLVVEIKNLINEKKLEFVGSSYTQSIFPLIPFEVNLKNLHLGIKVYKKTLGMVPKIFYVNEQAFSTGILDVYAEAGIENIIVDFDNTSEAIRSKKNNLYQAAE